jgi:hypothetical protein
MKETEYLLRNPSNAAALRRSIAELEQGDTVEREVATPGALGRYTRALGVRMRIIFDYGSDLRQIA